MSRIFSWPYVTSWVQSFSEKESLWSSEDRIAVAVSGGVDSMLLLCILARLREKGAFQGLVVIHVDHGTRSDQKNISLLIKAYCKKLKLELVEKRASFSGEESNFELKAREFRQAIYREYVNKGFKIALAHHLDDSFEWSLMQQFKSSKLASSIGIPVRNRGVIRPLMCLSKNHIESIARKLGVGWIDDESNKNIRFERNFIRHEVIERVSGRFPGYLKNYISRSYELLKPETNSSLYPKKFKSFIELARGPELKSFEGHEKVLRECIEKMGKPGRGKIRDQISKLVQCDRNGKHGPLSFSQGVEVICLKGHLYFYRKEEKHLFKEEWLEFYTRKGSQIPRLVSNNLFRHINKRCHRFIHEFFGHRLTKDDPFFLKFDR